MFLMFHILVFIIFFCEKSSTARRENNSNFLDFFEGNAEIFVLQRNTKGNSNIYLFYKRQVEVPIPTYQIPEDYQIDAGVF